MKKIIFVCALLVAGLSSVRAEVDPNFYIYLCFGQSNMEGNAQWESVDNSVNARFKMLATTNFSSPSRTLGRWYTATPPIVSPVGKLGMSDYFGRTMVAALPKDVKVGVVAVAMGGTPIEMFDKDKCEKKLADNPNEWWATITKNYYGGNAYQRLIDMARKAQETGVIKGILLHQGCSNNCDPNWPNMVKKIYNDMLTDLGLNAQDVPLFVGETLRQDQGGACYGHNSVIANMPKVVKTSHVIHSNGCPGNNTDPWHFNAAGYRTMGKRYAYSALQTMGLEAKKDSTFNMVSSLKKFFTVKSFDDHYDAKARASVTLQLWATFADGHREDLTEEATFTSTDFKITSGKVKIPSTGIGGIVTATYTDFFGEEHNVDMTIGTIPDGIEEIENGELKIENWTGAVYDLRGQKVTPRTGNHLPRGFYIINGKKVYVH
ncbi:MAG: hypothetical protein IJT75_04820 [Bacteroidaceae bacterium]|nr:hypothetical protein [Bacteroidaceae bacterium]